MKLSLTLLIAVVFTLSIYVALKGRSRRRAAKRLGCEPPPPVCAKWPLGIDLLIGALSALPKGKIVHFFHDVFERSGNNFLTNVLIDSTVNTMDPINIEAILSKQFTHFGIGSRHVTMGPLLGAGIFTLDGEGWKHSRELLRPQFTHKNLTGFKALDVEINNLIERIREISAASPSHVIDLKPLFSRLTLSTTTYMLFGRSIRALESMHPNDQAARVTTAFQYAQQFVAERDNLGSLYWLYDGFKFRKSVRDVHAYLDGEIAKVLSTPDPVKAAGEFSVLSGLVKLTRDPKVLREQSVNVLLAGRDTTAAFLTWSIFTLVRHPHVMRKLRHEVREARILDEEGEELPSTAALYRDMPYLGSVLKEVTRLLPAVPLNSRQAMCDTTLPVGGGADGKSPIFIRKGDMVGYCVSAMHRRKDLYGPDASEFRPERWEVPEGEPWCLNKIGWAFLPFNGGPRICLGRELAILSATLTIARMLRAFSDISLPEGEEVFPTGLERHELGLVLQSMDGCKVSISV